jgi:hypothetical protein
MSLSSLIVQREVATMRQVEDAMAHQVIYGGDLITNLLEVASVNEAALAQLLAESANVRAAPAGELPLATDAVRALVSGEIATQWSLVPLEAPGNRIVVAVVEPLSPEQQAQLALVLGRSVEQRLATTVRVRQAIAAAYGVALDRRLDKLVARLSGVGAKAGAAPSSLGASPVSLQQSHGTPAFGTAAHDLPRKAAMPAAAVPHRVTSSGFPSTSAPALPDPALGLPSAPPSPDGGGGVSLLQRPVSPSIRPSPRRRGPVTAQAARDAAEEATDRDTLLDLFFDFSRQFFEYSALFLVHGDIAEGRDAFGVGAPPAKVLGIGVPLDLPSVLSKARDERAPVVAKMGSDGLDAVLAADLQRGREVEVAVVPLVVRTRAVALFIGDCGEPGFDRATIDQVAQFAGTIGKAFERIIVRRKLDGFVAGSRAATTGRVDASMVREKRSVAPSVTPSVAPSVTPSVAPSLAPSVTVVRPSTPPRTSFKPEPHSAPPPTANIAVVRPISGPPIPREEPESPTFLIAAPPVAQTQVRRGVDEPSSDVHGLFDERAWEPPVEPAAAPPSVPPSSAVAVPLHRPPVSYSQIEGRLPSVIVDLESEFGELVDRVIAEQSEEAEGELLRQGERAMRVVMSRFPGPLTVERVSISETDRPPRPSECGPVLRLVVRERKVALPFVLERLEDDDAEVRGWATHVLCELPYAEAIPHLLVRLQDTDVTTCVSAALALAAVGRFFPGDVREAVMGLAHAVDPFDRGAAMHAMSELRQPALVPEMVHALGDGDERVVAAAHAALVLVTRQDFGADARPWLRWWEQNAGKHRVEWLIDALAHETSEIRRGAAEELRTVSKEYFGYSGDLPQRDRERAQQRYRDWWITEGRARFRRI